MQETQVQYLSQEDTPEKGMANHPNILTLRIPWTELWLAGHSLWTLKEFKHDWATNTFTLSWIQAEP